MANRRLKLSTPSEIRKALARVANMVLNEELDNKSAGTTIYAANIILSSIRTDEYGKKVEELEKRALIGVEEDDGLFDSIRKSIDPAQKGAANDER